LRKNNLTELAPKFRSDLAALIEQIHRNSSTISRILRLRRRQRWAEDGMRKCEVFFAQALSTLFPPTQKELVLKKLNGEPLTKTEQEHYSRIVKKKLEALANSEIRKIASSLTKKQTQQIERRIVKSGKAGRS